MITVYPNLNVIKIIKIKNYFNNFRYVIITANTTIKAAIPDSPKEFNKATKFVVTCEPKKATSGPNNISIAAGMFKNPTHLKTKRNIFVEKKLDYYKLDNRLPKFKRYPK